MARRDIEKIIGELGEIRRMLADPNTGITALYQVQESRHSKVLEHVTYSTPGVREENRELRRRQERMLGDLGEVRSAMEALRREIAQAWAHTLGLPHVPGTAVAGQVHDAQQQTPALEPGGDLDDEREGGASVSERPEPDAGGDRADGEPPAAAQAHRQPDVPDDEEKVLVAAQPLPAASDPHANGAAGVPAAASDAARAQPVVPGISPDGGRGSDTAGDPYRNHLRGLLVAACRCRQRKRSRSTPSSPRTTSTRSGSANGDVPGQRPRRDGPPTSWSSTSCPWPAPDTTTWSYRRRQADCRARR
ncbi:hypothetical protein ACWGA9_26720 [Streptomyces sp. NPDC054950]